MAVGVALGLKIKNKPNKVICLIGDGESNEGTVWESAMVAAKYQLGNLCVIADHNGSSDLVLPVTNPEEKWAAFGWEVTSINGHDEADIERALMRIHFQHNANPHVIIARTKKGYGVQFMEQNFGSWHAKVPTAEELHQIYEELEMER
jgi:transketolase